MRQRGEGLADAGGIDDRELSKIGGCLADGANFTQAIAVMDMAMKAFPDSAVLEKLKDSVVAKSTAAGDSEAWRC